MNKTFAGKFSKYRHIAVTHRLVDVNESRFIRSCSFVSVCFPQSAF